MTKYIDAEKLIAEVESLYDNMLKRIKIDKDNSDYWAGKADAYRNVIDTITSLQQKQTEESVPKDLEKAVENPYVLHNISHAAFEYERTRNDLDARSDNEVVRRAFIAGAKWDRSQMMKKAVEGEITKDNRGNNVVRTGVFNNGFEIGDKVRIIVIPNTDEK